MLLVPQRPSPMPKRRHDPDDSSISEPGGKRYKTDADGNTNGYIQNASSNLEYWLVRKPKNLTFDKLPPINFPKKLRESGREKEKDGYTFRFCQVNKQMFVIDRNFRSTANTLVQHKPIGTIKGMMNVEIQTIPDEDIGPIPPEEDYLDPNKVLEVPVFTYKISSIRKPVPPVDDVTERLIAFGVPKPAIQKGKKKKKKH